MDKAREELEKKKADFKAGKSLVVSLSSVKYQIELLPRGTDRDAEADVSTVTLDLIQSHPQVSGREVFEFRPELVDDDDDEADDTQYVEKEEESDEEEVIRRKHY